MKAGLQSSEGLNGAGRSTFNGLFIWLQVGPGCWARPQFLLLRASPQSGFQVFMIWLLAYPKASSSRDQSRSCKSFTNYPWESPTVTSAIGCCSHGLALVHCRRRLHKDINILKKNNDLNEPSWRLAMAYRVTNIVHDTLLDSDYQIRSYLPLLFKLWWLKHSRSIFWKKEPSRLYFFSF